MMPRPVRRPAVRPNPLTGVVALVLTGSLAACGGPAPTADAPLPAAQAPAAQVADPATRAEVASRCREIAAGVTLAGLGGSPVQADVRAAHLRLDTQMLLLPDPKVREATVSLHFDLHILDFALGTDDRALTARSLQDARTDIAELAGACGLPPARFGLG
jgi:hypothetical protein